MILFFLLLLLVLPLEGAKAKCMLSDYPLCCKEVVSRKPPGMVLMNLRSKADFIGALRVLTYIRTKLGIEEVWMEYNPWRYESNGTLSGFYINLVTMMVFEYNTGTIEHRNLSDSHKKHALFVARNCGNVRPCFELVADYSAITQDYRTNEFMASRVQFDISERPVSCSEAYSCQDKVFSLAESAELSHQARQFLLEYFKGVTCEIWIEHCLWRRLEDGRLKAYYIRLPHMTAHEYTLPPPNGPSSDVDLKHALYVRVYARRRADPRKTAEETLMGSIEAIDNSHSEPAEPLMSDDSAPLDLPVACPPRSFEPDAAAESSPQNRRVSNFRRAKAKVNGPPSRSNSEKSLTPILRGMTERPGGKDGSEFRRGRHGNRRSLIKARASQRLLQVDLQSQSKASAGSNKSDDACCSACLESKPGLTRLSVCGHKICPQCIRISPRCPRCPGPISEKRSDAAE